MTEAQKRSRRKRRIFAIGGGALVLLAGIGAVSASRSKTEVDPAKLVAVEKGDIARSVVATGKIEPLSKVEVKSKASGIVKRIFAEAGDHVKNGQVLLELDREELQARQREASASLLSAQAALQRTQVEAQGPDLPFLKTGMERARRLFEQGLVAPALVEDAEKAYELGLNKQQAAKANVAVNRAEVARAQAALERAENDLHNATIFSSMDGLVLGRNVEVGDAVSSILVMGSDATNLMTLGDVGSVFVRGKVDEADVGKISVGQPARITVESFKDKKFAGKVTRIAPLGAEKDNVTTFEVRVSISNEAGKLMATMTANAEIVLEERKGVLAIPEGAIIYKKDRSIEVEVPDAGTETGRRRVAVATGIGNGSKTQILKGLSEGQRVILQ